ncbi:hypothetical protein CYY_005112 [Polysphondylium violaceum]|uniref:TH1 domain-containing protein n=1 Tax=Polysphondylium violaceum TaxID=133409 RepID=A0A8J4PS91_9MYCE|nr:hypothetical protein CYY_005112 [Polysphondylium violaceum]
MDEDASNNRGNPASPLNASNTSVSTNNSVIASGVSYSSVVKQQLHQQQKGFTPPASNSIRINSSSSNNTQFRSSPSSLSPPGTNTTHFTTIMTGSLSPSTASTNNFSLLNDIYFHNLGDINDMASKGNSAGNSSSNSTATTTTNSRSNSGGNSLSTPIGPPKHDVDLIVQTTKQEDARFMGRKKRRNSSVSKVFLGDFLKLSNNVSTLKMMSKYGDNRILFSDVLTKVNKRNKMQERIIIITDKSIYNVHPTDYKLKRRISLESVTALSMSTMEDNFIIFHVNSEYDYVLISGRKIEIATILVEAYYNLAFYHITPLDPTSAATVVGGNGSNLATTAAATTTASNHIGINSPSHKSSNNSNSNSTGHPSPSSSPSTTSTALNMITTISNTLFSQNNNSSSIPSISGSTKDSNSNPPSLKDTSSGPSNTNTNNNDPSLSATLTLTTKQANSNNGNGMSSPRLSIMPGKNNNNSNNNTNSNTNSPIMSNTTQGAPLNIIQRVTGSVLPVFFNDRIEYKIEGDSMREIVFTRAQGAVNISIQTVRSKMALHKKETSRTSITSPSSSLR